MQAVAGFFSRFIGNNENLAHQRLEEALHSLKARGVVESFHDMDGKTPCLRLQWDRGNFGHEVALSANSMSAEVIVRAIALPTGPFGGKEPSTEILPITGWRPVGEASSLGVLKKLPHTTLVEAIRLLEASHPALEWFEDRFKALAKGVTPEPAELSAMVLLGARKFLKTIPNANRLNEAVEPAMVTLLRAAAREKQESDGDDNLLFSADSGFAQALVSFIQETHPLDAKRAAHKFAMG